MVDRNLELGIKPPSWYDDEPDLAPWHDFFCREFWELSTERFLGFTIGPIPVSKIEERAERHGFDSAMVVIYKALIRVQDNRYMKWVVDERDKAHSRAGKGKTSGQLPRGRKSRRR